MQPVIPVFIASPSDVQPERRATEKAVQTLAPRLARLFGVTLVPVMWEEFAPISSFDASHPQVGILRHIQPFSIFVGILWKRHGTPIPNSQESGTETEFSHALLNRDKIEILTYFRELPKAQPRGKNAREQRALVEKLKKRLRNENVSMHSYKDEEEFRDRILPDLMEAALDLILSKEPKKVLDYMKFFLFGSHHRLGTRPLLIIYPPITDPGPGHRKPRLDWRQRLLPHVVYEDSKALQDIEEAMRRLGREYKTVTTDSPDLHITEPGDRIWVCVPRNRKAHRVLRDLGPSRVRFRFDSRKDKTRGDESCLFWKQKGKELQIVSPLGKYLSKSHRPNTEDEWRPLYGYTYCRDYAVLARFKVFLDPEDTKGEYYYHYFIGGVRGLGTWGVGYLIDHLSSRLVRMTEAVAGESGSDDVQLLLEVTYENYRVTRVEYVGDKDQKFFDERYSDEYIERQLRRRPEWLPLTKSSGSSSPKIKY